MLCTSCGTEIKDKTLQFCTNCGATLEKEAATQDGSTQSTSASTASQPINEDESLASVVQQTEAVQGEEKEDIGVRQTVAKNPKKSKRNKILLSILVILLLALFGTYKWFENYYDPMKELIAMDEAIKGNKQASFLGYIATDDDVYMDEKAYFNYIKEEEWDTVKRQYESLIQNKKSKSSALGQEIISEDGEVLFYVKEKKHLYGLFKGYALEAVPIPFVLTSNMDKTKVKVAGQEIELKKQDKKKDLGEFYPGTYEVEATAKGKYGNFEFDEEIEVYATEKELIDIEFESDSFYVQSAYGFEDAILFIDGKSTDQKIGDSLEVGPLPIGSNMKLHAEWKNSKGNVVRSNTETISDSDYSTNIYFEFDERNTFQADTKEVDEQEAGGYVLAFREAYEDAVNYADFSYITPYLKDGSHAAKDLAPFVKGMGEGSYYYEFDENTVTDVKNKKDGNFEVYTNELFTFYDDDGKVYDYNRDKKYFLETVDGSLQITKIDYVDTKKSSK